MNPQLLVCAPLWCERQALRAGLDEHVLLRRTGYGPRRSERAVRSMAAVDFGAMVVAGLGGGVSDAVPSGSVVVGSEIRCPSGPVRRCPAAEPLADEVRRLGMVVHYGPIWSGDHVVHGAERAALARSGTLAVDMESAALAVLAGERPLAVVRVVVDTGSAPLARLATVGRALTALRRLRELGLSLRQWGASRSHDRVDVAEHAAPEQNSRFGVSKEVS